MPLHQDDLSAFIKRALEEDVGRGDITTEACVPPDRTGAGHIRAHASGILSGLEVARQVFLTWDPGLIVGLEKADGERVQAGDEVLTVSGRLASIMTAERVALNFLCHLSGVATLTARYVEAVEGKIRILDTRKTLPGFRRLQKQAVVHGGGTNHRERLDSAILIKDNHLAAAGGIEGAVRRIREAKPGERIILEVR
ncbi:MAG: carboxylating nicotinate-nucleotide diphosphorylase, partial [Candidatus Eisenbacteria bacterium]|nr:carboxylating nicotinate-nucleotide diphosphorylase [Candidatus Eisenbacteria bacterium]